jgi:hypothetical protein
VPIDAPNKTTADAIHLGSIDANNFSEKLPRRCSILLFL